MLLNLLGYCPIIFKIVQVCAIYSSLSFLVLRNKLTIVLRLFLSVSLQSTAKGNSKPIISSRLASEKSSKPRYPMYTSPKYLVSVANFSI